MIDENLIKEKIRKIQEYLSEIEHLFVMDTKEIVSNVEKLRTMERNFQLVVDEMIDINIHIIKEMNFESPDDFQNTFKVLGQKEILPLDFTQKIAPIAGLRNMIVHRYEKLDIKLFVNTFKSNRSDFDRYMKFIQKYLEKK